MDATARLTTSYKDFESNEAIDRLGDRQRVLFSLLPASVQAVALTTTDIEEIAKKAWQLADRLSTMACNKCRANRARLLADLAAQQAEIAATETDQTSEAAPAGTA
jgi:hypothetical protein